MQFGAHAFVWEGEWNEEAAARIFAGAADAGLDFVEIPLLRPDEFDPAKTRRRLEQHGLGATFSLGLPPDSTLPDNPKRAGDFLTSVLSKIEDTGSDTLTGVIYGTLGSLPGRPPSEEDYAVIADTLAQVADDARSRHMRLGIEPVNRYETFLINTAGQAVDLVRRIGAENVFVHLDTYHLNIEEEGYSRAIRTAGELMQYVHLSESHRGTPGTGTVDWDDVFDGLREISFPGALVMESFVRLNPDIARATCMWREIVTDPDRLVRDGVAFLKKKAQEYGLP
jgi:D-psicose/D-tagatose/L-ribulose 3-epimerase